MDYSKRSGIARLATAMVVGPILLALTLSGCISIPTGGPSTPAPTVAGPVSYLERLKATPVVKPTDNKDADQHPAFVNDSRNIACVFTKSRNGHLDLPWEPNNFSNAANAASPIIPVVTCQMARYPEPIAADIKDNCSGTSIGYLGGTVLLMPSSVSYGSCRAGVTAVESAFGTEGTANEVMGKIPVLEEGQAVEADGYRCSPMDTGVACANLASGLGFFVTDEKYELFGPGHTAVKSTPSSSSSVASGSPTEK